MTNATLPVRATKHERSGANHGLTFGQTVAPTLRGDPGADPATETLEDDSGGAP